MMSAFSSRHAADPAGPRAHCPEWVIVNDEGWQIIFTNRREDSDPLDPPEPTAAPAPARGPSQRGRLGAQKVHACRERRTDGGGGQQGARRHLLAPPPAAR